MQEACKLRFRITPIILISLISYIGLVEAWSQNDTLMTNDLTPGVALGLGLGFYIVTRDRRALWLFVGLSLTQFLNMAPVLALVDRLLVDAFARAAAGTLDRDYKTQIQELAQSRVRASPRYRVVSESGPDHEKTFEVELEIKGEALGRGAGRSKKDAEQAAARVALEALGARIVAGGFAGEGRRIAGRLMRKDPSLTVSVVEIRWAIDL